MPGLFKFSAYVCRYPSIGNSLLTLTVHSRVVDRALNIHLMIDVIHESMQNTSLYPVTTRTRSCKAPLILKTSDQSRRGKYRPAVAILLAS